MACYENPQLAKIHKIKENRNMLYSDTGSFPKLSRDQMTNIVDPVGSIPRDTLDKEDIATPGQNGSFYGGPSGGPSFKVPPNPLVPDDYNETLDYEALQYINGFYRTQIGRYVRVEQQTYQNNIEMRYGYLVGVGTNYLILQDITTGNIFAIDTYSIKLFHVYYNFEGSQLLPVNPRMYRNDMADIDK